MRLLHGGSGHLANPSCPASAYGFHVASATARQGAPGWSRPPSSPRREASLFDFGRYPNGLAPFFLVFTLSAGTEWEPGVVLPGLNWLRSRS